MLRVIPLPAFSDNYIWTILSSSEVSGRSRIVVVDPGDAEVVKSAINEKNWSLAAILITHHHLDHTGGITELKKAYGAPVYGPLNSKIPGIDFALSEGDHLSLQELNLEFRIIEVPGHTLDHIAYIHSSDKQTSLFCGDTLFSAGCGRMFEGTAKQFSQSLSKIKSLPHKTAIYCTHEYTQNNLRFAAHIRPQNVDIREYQKYVESRRMHEQPTVPSTLALELLINPFLQCDNSEIQRRVADLSGTETDILLNDPVQTFASMRQLKDNF